MLKAMIALATVFVSFASYGKEIAVFEIRRPLSFENGQDLPKDFYINAGIEVGLKVGMSVGVNRRQTLYDPFQNKSPGDLIIPVGRLRIIHVQDNISVARLEVVTGREALPTLDFDAIMVGDRLDMSTAKMSSGKRADGSKSDEGEATNASLSAPVPNAAALEVAPSPAPAPVASSPANIPQENTAPAPKATENSPVASFALPTDGPTL